LNGWPGQAKDFSTGNVFTGFRLFFSFLGNHIKRILAISTIEQALSKLLPDMDILIRMGGEQWI